MAARERQGLLDFEGSGGDEGAFATFVTPSSGLQANGHGGEQGDLFAESEGSEEGDAFPPAASYPSFPKSASASTSAQASPGRLHRFNAALRGEQTRVQNHYADFSTIDWARDSVREQTRQRGLRARALGTREGAAAKLWDASQGWLVVFLVGVAAGFAAGCVDVGSAWLQDLKEGYCPNAFYLNLEHCCWAEEVRIQGGRECDLWRSWSQSGGIGSGGAYAYDFLAYVGLATGFAGLCAVFVRRLAPYAAASGIPETKTILSGFIIRGYFGMWTLIVKAMGLVLAVASGLSLGKEGPLVHVACCCGNVFCRIFPKYSKNEAKKREVLSAAAAAGVSVAFGAPVGGVLFSLEEVSYYFPHKTMWRAFFAAMVAAAMLAQMNPFVSGGLVKFSIEYTHPWHWFEFLPFIALGVFGGIFGAAFNYLNLRWCHYRKTSWLGRYPVSEALVLAFVTALLSYPNIYTRSDSSELIKNLFAECEGTLNTPLCNSDSSKTLTLLFLACLLKMVATVFTFGAKVPAGLFIPSMAVGATMGRILGELMDHWAKTHSSSGLIGDACPDIETCITPGLYAMVGAAAALGGVTRMTVSLVVIMLELTHGLTYLIPLMLGVMVSKWVGDALWKDGIYDGHIHLNGYPFLDNKQEFSKSTIVSDVMKPPRGATEELVCIHLEEENTVESIETLLENHAFTGLPIVQSETDASVVGYVDRRELLSYLGRAKRVGGARAATRVIFEDQSSFVDPAPGLDVFEVVQSTPFQFVPDMPMAAAIQVFQRLGVRYALVVEHGRLIGLLTKKDVLRHMAAMANRDPNQISFH